MKTGLKAASLVLMISMLTACGTDRDSNAPKLTNPKSSTSRTHEETSTATNANGTNGSTKASDSTSYSEKTPIKSDSPDSKTAESSSSKISSKSDSASGIQVVKDPTSITVLVNKTHKLPDGYVPPHLVYPKVAFPYSDLIEKRMMRDVAAKALESMFAAAKNDGIVLYGESGYRSYIRQESVYAYNVKTKGKAQASIVSAYPGTSEHQTGLAMDITAADVQDDLVQAFGSEPEGKWVAKHAHEYGFIIRYPKGKESITGYEYEPWHIRYVGVKAATYIYEHHLTLEEYATQKENS
ncbi:M15 family metallopeptidase [Pullulanibacillus sp. KACC 23026]|uniref:M15 family metallopeptidase n=1 Tax=Pullulanibacillus sp. KACC 23026 TaxID=3028315 RepID=UPI0023AFD45A|nr:M15 family metallopeptidase [Pullulanibacillus sp. KACC 23026]WEG11491.1 M15 family metallopeptidase [Pullulanibacillus sp. KACC 23026]